MLVLPNLIAKTMTLDDVKDVHAKQIENIRLAMLDLQKTATMAKLDYELPADWKEKTERRKPQLSPKLKAVLTALQTPVEIDKSNAPLIGRAQGAFEGDEAADHPGQGDDAGRRGRSVDADDRVSRVRRSRARTALKMALAQPRADVRDQGQHDPGRDAREGDER